MKWVAISGTWRITNEKIESDVRTVVKDIISSGDGIVTGGALNVDYFATDEALMIDPTCKQLKIFLPASLDIYAKHYRKWAKESVISEIQSDKLITQLEKVKSIKPKAIIENTNNKVVGKAAYFDRNTKVVEVADELIAFRVNLSRGVTDAIKKAENRRIPVRIFEYSIK